MFYQDRIWFGVSEGEKVCILPSMANRHGLIAGATGTGKTVTLKVLAESFSDAGVPVFLADVKGDLSGMCRPGEAGDDLEERIRRFGLKDAGFHPQAYPTAFWDIYGRMGIPLRTTISEMGPVLLSKLMGLTPTQSDILTVLFKVADDQQLLLIDTKDLKAMLQYLGENSQELSMEYGNISKQSISAIIRHVVALESQGGNAFFAEPALNIADWFFTGTEGKGGINILDCRELIQDGTLYSAFLLWMLSELFEALPEIGDPDKPRMVFFFDEAHLLFQDISKPLQAKIEQVVKLIRSKGVGIYFITQNPRDIPDGVLGQLGNKIQHALRAYTPSDEKAIKAAADSFRPNPALDTRQALTQLGTGEALVSLLDEDGVPGIVSRCSILPPQSLMGAISDREKEQEVLRNSLYLKYQDMVDRDSAYEFLKRKGEQDALEEEQKKLEEARKKQEEKEAAAKAKQEEKDAAAKAKQEEKEAAAKAKQAEKEAAAKAKQEEKEAEKRRRAISSGVKSVANTAAGTIGREIGNNLGKQVGGSFGKKLGGNLGASLGRSILGTFLNFRS